MRIERTADMSGLQRIFLRNYGVFSVWTVGIVALCLNLNRLFPSIPAIGNTLNSIQREAALLMGPANTLFVASGLVLALLHMHFTVWLFMRPAALGGTPTGPVAQFTALFVGATAFGLMMMMHMFGVAADRYLHFVRPSVPPSLVVHGIVVLLAGIAVFVSLQRPRQYLNSMIGLSNAQLTMIGAGICAVALAIEPLLARFDGVYLPLLERIFGA